MRKIEFNTLRQFFYHFFAILLAFLILVLIRYPTFLNSDYSFTPDEGLMASTILDLLNGGPIVFYYDFGRTFGLTFGLAAAPFIWLFGDTTLAYNLPATLFYSLYLWTTYLIAKILVPRTAYLILIMLFFTPSFITHLTVHNWPHVPAAFLGNLMFLLFIKIKLSERNNSLITFGLFFTMGLAIYTYTFSTIYILTIGILFVLTHPRWGQIRGEASFENLKRLFKNRKTIREIICQLLDVLIVVVFIVVVFSYIFGGFGLDIGGISILQVNKFHKAATQLLVLIFLRILVNPKGALSFLSNTKSYFLTGIHSDKKHLATVGGAGFLLGLSPRIASILMGETSQGGQGHDFDFLPTKLLAHSYDLLALKGPELLGLDRSFQDLVSNPIGTYWVIHCALLLFLVAVFLLSAFFFIFENRTPLKSIVTLRGMQFNAAHIILLAPILVCMANIATQNGPMPRYLFPLFGIFTLWIGICVDKIQEKVKWLPILVMVMWVSFYSITNYHAYQAAGLIEEGGKPVKLKKHFIYDVLDFLESKKIPVAYSDYGLAGMGTFLSGGEINISEYSNDPKAKARKERSMSHLRFAVIAKDGPAAIYKSYFQEKRIKFQTVSVAGYEIFWDFAGRGAEINNLRSLIFEI